MPDEIVERLKRLKPSVERSELDLLYQVGWQAAIASFGEAPTTSKPRRVFTTYLFGAVSGLAVSALFVLMFDPNHPHHGVPQIEANAIGSNLVQEQATSGDDSFDPKVSVNDIEPTLDVSSSLDRIASTSLSPVARENWHSLLDERSIDLQSSEAEPSEFLNRESLQSILKSFPGI